MGIYSTLNNKIGWKQFLSGLSIDFFTGFFFKPESFIVVSKDKGVEGKFFDEKKVRWRLFRYEKILISNSGMAPLTLRGLRPLRSQTFSGIIASFIKDIKAQEVKSEILLVENSFEDLKHNDIILSSYKGWTLEKLGDLRRIIPAGGTTMINLVLLYDAYEGRKAVADYIITRLEIFFSTGTTYPYKVITKTMSLTKPFNNLFTLEMQG